MSTDAKYSARASADSTEALFSPARVRTGADTVLDVLDEHNIDVVFGYPGGAIMPLHDALFNHRVRHVLMRHEAGAAFAASGYARSTGRVGVCLATSGPGATNLVTGIADAMLDNVPLVAITGQVKTALMGTDAFQEVDIASVTQAITKRNIVVRSAADIRPALEAALALAQGPCCGPVLVDMPSDVLKAAAQPPAGDSPRRRRATASAFACDDAILETVNALGSAQRPVLIVGGGARWSGAAPAFRRLCALLDAPHCCTLHGLGAAAGEDPNALGMLGMHGWSRANRAVAQADMVIALGMRFDDRVTGDPASFAAQARTIVHADIDEAEFDKIVPAHIKLHGDVRVTLERLCAALEKHEVPRFTHWAAQARSLGAALPGDDAGPAHLSATGVLDAFFEMAAHDSIVTTDVGQHQMWAAQRARPADPHAFLSSGGLGSMGFGVPAAIGAKFAHPDRAVVAIVGDGGFQMSLAELATLRRYDLPVKILLIDNRNLGMVRQWQELFYQGRYSATNLWDNPDFAAVARAYGIAAWSVDAQTGVREAMRAFLDARTPALLHALCYPGGNVYPMIPSGGSIADLIDPAAR
ncbi:MAG TPA: biosynthetic-type acetolactate synthase large subunit [Candidatus Baltobacteraceae bacterium]|nr:biosynthetic-type acetolactate synthase large subunit [Candidatus Baltobacteraceae bacterium]